YEYASVADAILSQAVLNQSADLSLGINSVGNHWQNHDKNDADNFQQGGEDEESYQIHAILTWTRAAVDAQKFPHRSVHRAVAECRCLRVSPLFSRRGRQCC